MQERETGNAQKMVNYLLFRHFSRKNHRKKRGFHKGFYHIFPYLMDMLVKYLSDATTLYFFLSVTG